MNSTTTGSAKSVEQPLHRGTFSINVSMIAFVVGDTTMKLLGRSFPTNDLIFLRSAIASALAAIILTTGKRPTLKAILAPPMLVRCFFDCE